MCVAVDGDGGIEEIDGIRLDNAPVTTVAPVARVIVAGVIVIVVLVAIVVTKSSEAMRQTSLLEEPMMTTFTSALEAISSMA